MPDSIYSSSRSGEDLPPQAHPVAWMTRESQHRLAAGGNCKGAVPVHGKRSATATIPLYAAMSATADIRWALMALHLVRNKLVAMGVAENDTAMENLAAAEKTLLSIVGVKPGEPS